MKTDHAGGTALATPAIEGRGICKSFGTGPKAVTALDMVDFSIRKGEFFTLLGPSGCGKTTLLRVIAGFEMPGSGSLFLSGQPITELPPNRRRINTVFQNYALFPHLTVAENIGFGLKMQGKPKAEIARRTQEMIAMVRLQDLADRRPAQMSGGQQQRVALARALAPAPEVLLLDEPLSALDLKLRKDMQAELKRLQAQTGITFVFVTHDQEEALTMSDRIAVMAEGRIQQTGTPNEIYTRPANRFVADFIGDTNFLPAMIRNGVAALPSGDFAVATSLPDGPAVIAVRPEQLSLTSPDQLGSITAIAEGSTYFGTDSHVILRLDGDIRLTLRLPTAIAAPPEAGSTVGIKIAPDAAMVLNK